MKCFLIVLPIDGVKSKAATVFFLVFVPFQVTEVQKSLHCTHPGLYDVLLFIFAKFTLINPKSILVMIKV